MRLFLAINLASETRAAVVDAAAGLRDVAPGLRWAAESQVHLTLKFLGEQETSLVPALAGAVDAVARQHFTFEMRVGGDADAVGAFPNFRRARVVWMGVAHEPRLELLHHDVEVACEAIGFGIEGRPFRPHLTLARVGEKMDAKTAGRLERAARKIAFDAVSVVASVDLMQSLPGSLPRYERVHASALRSR